MVTPEERTHGPRLPHPPIILLRLPSDERRARTTPLTWDAVEVTIPESMHTPTIILATGTILLLTTRTPPPGTPVVRDRTKITIRTRRTGRRSRRSNANTNSKKRTPVPTVAAAAAVGASTNSKKRTLRLTSLDRS